MQLSNIDIKQLRIFMAVSECGGFTAAEDVLGLSQPAISANIADLESRLGFRVCKRGRSGFHLTERGEELYRAATELLESLGEFEERAGALRGVLTGRLRLGLIDNLITDPLCIIAPALAELSEVADGIRISVEIMAPAEIEYAVAAGRLDIGISIAEKNLPSLRYSALYDEVDLLYCGRRHHLFLSEDVEQIRANVSRARKVIRSFLNRHDTFVMGGKDDPMQATVKNLEAAAFLILAGTHIGFLPMHYAKSWVESDDMRALLPNQFVRSSQISMIEPLRRSGSPQAIARFAAAIRRGNAKDRHHKMRVPGENC